jgi:hypothetical protein
VHVSGVLLSSRYSQAKVMDAFTEVLGFSPVNCASGSAPRERRAVRSHLALLLPLERYAPHRYFGEAR